MPIPQAAHYINCPLHVLPINGVLLYKCVFIVLLWLWLQYNEIYLILNKIQTILWSLFERVDRVPGVEGADGAGRGVAGGGEAQQGVDQLGQVQHGVAQQQAQVTSW